MSDATDPATAKTGDVPVRITETLEVAEGVRSLVLSHADGAPLPSWTPGAHIDLVLRDGLIRPYSLCGDPQDDTRWQVAVLREPEGRGGSEFVHTSVGTDDQLVARAPQNHFPLVDAEEYALIAGGIGITPLLPMIDELERRGAGWRLLYGGRRRASMAFLQRLEAFGSRVTVAPEDENGMLDLAGWLGPQRPGVAVYCCGPGGLIDAVETTCRDWPAGTLHVERFRPDPEALEGEDAPFDVVASRSGVTVRVAEGETIIDALEAVDILVPYSCGEGTCGTCMTQVLEGQADHRDVLLTDEERAEGQMLPCCSRSKTRVIVLDV